MQALDVMPDAIALIISGRPPTALFGDKQRRHIEDAFAAITAAAELMGRARIRELHRAAVAAIKFADDPFRVRLPWLDPSAALDFFRRAIPNLFVDAKEFVARHLNLAAELAGRVESVLLGRVKRQAAELIKTKKPVDLQILLDRAGLSPTDQRYGNFVFRTAVLEYFNDGSTLELASPDVRDVFPVWHYTGILDDRTGDDHRPKVDKYYPSSVTFRQIRGPRIWNCRCGFVPLDKWQWAELRKKGARVQTSYVIHPVTPYPARNVAGQILAL
jgi:hypothetical protein